MLITQIDDIPLLKHGKNKGKLNGNFKVEYKCDNCGKIFSIRFCIIQKDNKPHYCIKCNGHFNGKKSKGKYQNNPTHKRYWINKGYSEEEATLFIKQKKKCCKEYWINKGYSEEEAKEKSTKIGKKCCKQSIEYWINKGYSEEEAKKEIKEHQNKSNYFGEYDKNKQNVLVEQYWINKGYSEEEAKENVRREQYNRRKNRDDKSIGRKLSQYWKDNPNKLNKIRKKISKSLLKKKCTHSPIFIEYWINKGYSEEEAKYKVYNIKYLNKTGARGSKIESKCIDILEQKLNIKILRNKFIQYDKTSVYCVDGKFNKWIFEFFGTNPHLDDRFYNINSKNPWGRSFITVKEYDNFKLYNLINRHYKIFVIWEYDFLNDKILFKKIKEKFLKYETYKQGKCWCSKSL